MNGTTLRLVNLAQRDYDTTWDLQKSLHARVTESGGALAWLILVEHPPVITLGRRANRANVLLDPADLARRGILLREVDRGGDVTYHGPGQLVAYPILPLIGKRRDVHDYFRSLEQVVIELLGDYGIVAGREEGLTGVWVGAEKVCAMGVAIRHWVTYHGLALNVNTNLDHFRFITPCGIAGKRVTSMARLLGREVPMQEVADRLVAHLAREFGFRSVECDTSI